MDMLFQLIRSAVVHNNVKAQIMKVFLGMVPTENEEEMHDDELLQGLVQEKSNISVGPCFQFTYGKMVFLKNISRPE